MIPGDPQSRTERWSHALPEPPPAPSAGASAISVERVPAGSATSGHRTAAAQGAGGTASRQPPVRRTASRHADVAEYESALAALQVDEPSSLASRGPLASGRHGAQSAHGQARGGATTAAAADPQSNAAAPPARPIADRVLRRAPPWLVSWLCHMLVLIGLGLWLLPSRSDQIVTLQATMVSLDEVPSDNLPPLDLAEQSADESVVVLERLIELDDPFATPPELPVRPEGFLPEVPRPAPTVGLALAGRSEGMKRQLIESQGGTGRSEQAVLRALEWLARQQRPDGSWSLRGPYTNGASMENAMAATAMALLAFQGAGHTHQQGPFKQNVAGGITFLLRMQGSDGNFFRHGPQTHQLYTQGQCTMAVCELFAMTGDEELRKAAQRAVEYCCRAQDRQGGGWRYRPGYDSDTSVTGWMVMALKSGQLAGLAVSDEVFVRVGEYLDLASADGGITYAYQPQDAPTAAMTAEALLCRQYLGWRRDDPRLATGVATLVSADNLPRWDERNVYYWYYATQVMHHYEGESWQRWNGAMRDLLVDHQVLEGREAGSWHPTQDEADRWGFHGGRLFVTCLSVYVLEVYYRHLPIYRTTAVAAP